MGTYVSTRQPSPTASHQIVRTSTGKLYCVTYGSTHYEIGVFYGGTDGSSWAEKDQANAPAGAHVAAAIDGNDVIHIHRANNIAAMEYETFDTVDAASGNDTYNNDSTPSIALGGSPPSGDGIPDIAIDDNGVAHFCALTGEKDKGTAYDAACYCNWVGGSLNNEHSIQGGDDAINASAQCIIINGSNVPVVSIYNIDDDDIKVALGDANDPSSWSIATVDATVGAAYSTVGGSLAMDSNDKVWVAYVDSDGTIDIAQQPAGAWTDAWTIQSNGNSGTNPVLAITGTDVYVIYEDDANDIVYDMWNGTGWAGETALETGTFSTPHALWATNHQNANYNSVGIDYIYNNAGDTYYGNLSIAEPYVPQIMMIV